MSTKKSRKKLTVDGRRYVAFINAPIPFDGPVRMRLTLCADYGHRSVCTFRGLTNRWRYDYSNYDPDTLIVITPRVIAGLVRFAHGRGWDPPESKTNAEFNIDNDLVQRFIKNDDMTTPRLC